MDPLNPNVAQYAEQVRVRVCGICINNGKLLLVRHQPTVGNKAFWAPPGGGLHYGESLHQCLIREFLEETGLEITVNRFLYVSEFMHKPLHAIEIFFEVKINGGNLLTGTDPEASTGMQLIEQVSFLSRHEINEIPSSDKHRILHYLFSLDDLLGLPHHFLSKEQQW